MVKKNPARNPKADELKPYPDEPLGQYLRRLRLIRHINLSDVSVKTSQAPDSVPVSVSYLSQLELGRAQNPSREILNSLAKVLEVPTGPLLELAGYSSHGAATGEDEADPQSRQLALRLARLDPVERNLLDTMIQGLLEHHRKAGKP